MGRLRLLDSSGSATHLGCLQTVLIDGRHSNAGHDEIDAYLELVRWIAPEEVQLYSTDRPVAETGVERVPSGRLRQIARLGTARTGVPFRVHAA